MNPIKLAEEEMQLYKRVSNKTVRMLVAELQEKQAKIDALMLEYCPEEMTYEQLSEWAKHQNLNLKTDNRELNPDNYPADIDDVKDSL